MYKELELLRWNATLVSQLASYHISKVPVKTHSGNQIKKIRF